MRGLTAHHWMRKEPVDAALARLARVGFRQVELFEPLVGTDPEPIKRLLARHDLRCSAMVIICDGSKSLVSPDADTRHRGIELLRAGVDAAAAVGATALTVLPTPVGHVRPALPRAQEWDACTEALAQAASWATGHGIRLGIECLNRHESYLFPTARHGLAMASAIGGDHGVVLDTFHMNIEEDDPALAIELAGDRLVGFHVADHHRRAVGSGHVPWELVWQALDRVDYQGTVAVECTPDPALGGEDDGSAYEASLLGSRRALEALEAGSDVRYRTAVDAEDGALDERRPR